MNRTTKKYIWIIASVVVVGSGIMLLSSGDDNAVNNSSTNTLNPEQSITHGHGLAIDVEDPSTLYIATHHGLLVLKNDKDLYRIGNSYDDYMGFTTHPTNPSIFYTSGHPVRGGNLGFQISEDSGFTWQKVSNGIDGPVDFHVMTVSPADPNLAYGWFQGALQRSIDEGKTWSTLTPQIVEPISFVPHPRDSNVLYAVTIYDILRSIDRGQSWEVFVPREKSVLVTSLAIDPNDPRTMILYSRTHGLQKSTDEGKTWRIISETFNGEIVLYITIAKSDNNIAYLLTSENSIHKSIDGGETWARIR